MRPWGWPRSAVVIGRWPVTATLRHGCGYGLLRIVPEPSTDVITSEQVRRILLGQEGPWADPRTAVDTIDNVDELLRVLDQQGRTELADAAVALFTDDDVVVRSGAVVVLGMVRHHVDVSAVRADVAQCVDWLTVEPVGFRQLWRRTLLDEVLSILGEVGSAS